MQYIFVNINCNASEESLITIQSTITFGGIKGLQPTNITQRCTVLKDEKSIAALQKQVKHLTC